MELFHFRSGIQQVFFHIGFGLLLLLGGCTPPESSAVTPFPSVSSSPSETPNTPALLIEPDTKLIGKLGNGVFSSLTLSPDGSLAGVILSDGLHWFDSMTLAEQGSSILGYPATESQIFFSPNNAFALVGNTTTAHLIDLKTNLEISLIQGIEGWLSGFIFSPDSRYLAFRADTSTSICGSAYIAVIDVTDGSERGGCTGGYEDGVYEGSFITDDENSFHTISAPAISPDGKWIAAGDSDGTVYIWSMSSGEKHFSLSGHADQVTGVAFSPDGSLLASSSADGTARLWRVSSGKIQRVVTGFLGATESVAFSEDGTQIIVQVEGLSAQAVNLSDGEMADWTGAQNPVIQNLAEMLNQQGYMVAGDTPQIIFSPDGTQLATGQGNIAIYDVQTQSLFNTLVLPISTSISGLVYSPDGIYLAAMSAKGDGWVWQMDGSDEPVLTIRGNIPNVSRNTGRYPGIFPSIESNRGGLRFSPDGTFLAIGNGIEVQVWDVTSGEMINRMERVDAPSRINLVSYSADGKFIYAMMDNNNAAAVWDASSGALIQETRFTNEDPTNCLIGNLFQSQLARTNLDSSNNRIEIQNLSTNASAYLPIDQTNLAWFSFSQNGNLLLGGESDHQVSIWQVATGESVQFDLGDTVILNGAASPDLGTFAGIREDGISLWQIDGLQAWLAQTQAIGEENWQSLESSGAGLPSSQTTPNTDAAAVDNLPQAQQISQFGGGTIDWVDWSQGGTAVLVAGSMGYTKYRIDYPEQTMNLAAEMLSSGWAYSIAKTGLGRTRVAGVVDGKRVQVWDVDTGNAIADLEGSGKPALSPDGTILAYLALQAGDNSSLTLYNLANHEILHTLGDIGPSQQPVFSPDGSLIAVLRTGAYQPANSSVRVWNVATGRIVAGLSGPDAAINEIAFSADGQYLFGAAGDAIWMWNLADGQVESILKPFSMDEEQTQSDGNWITTLATSPDGSLLAAGTGLNSILILNAKTGGIISRIDGFANHPVHLVFHPDSAWLVCAESGGNLSVWNVETGKAIGSVNDNLGSQEGLIFGVDGNLVTWENNMVWWIKPDSGAYQQSITFSAGEVVTVSPDGYDHVISTAGGLSLTNTRENQAGIALGDPAGLNEAQGSGYTSAEFNADGSRLVIYGERGWALIKTASGKVIRYRDQDGVTTADFNADSLVTLSLPDGLPAVWDAQAGDWKRYLSVEGEGTDPILDVSLGIGGTAAAILENTGKIWIWDLEDGNTPGSLSIPGNPLSLALSPDGRMAAVGLADGSIVLVDIADLRIATTLEGHRGAVTHLAFNADGSLLASASEDGTVRVWGAPE